MILFLAHCGFYDPSLGEGLYEFHVNLFTLAPDWQTARRQIKEMPEFKEKRMHIDGLQEIHAVEGHMIVLVPSSHLEGKSHFVSYRHRDLATGSLENSVDATR